ncbi:MAG: hypothetical protein ONB33_03935 [candidate division KSB1 bacterium]|nr:hypothetical protein [candidate division KSB1 bacterium]MDZ7356738.1 hypothetical protein [candidate division KSB1 bacterium]
MIGLILSLAADSLYPQATYVPLNHWVYDYLERLEAKRVIHGFVNSSKPLSRIEIAQHLAKVHLAMDALNQIEQDQLNFLNIEFKEELAGLFEHSNAYQTRIQQLRNNKCLKKVLPDFIYRNNRNLFSWREDQFQLFFDPIIYRYRSYSSMDASSRTERLFQNSNGIRLWGNWDNYLGFFIDVRDTKEWGTQKYRLGNYTLPRLGFVRATSPDYIYHDETVAYLKVGFKNFQLAFGKFSNYWGNGRTGSLILSDYATSYDQLKLEFIFKKFKFTSLYAQLIDYEEHEQDILQPKKYFAGHRLEFLPWFWLALGLSESVIFKGRNFEPAYINPVMFFRSAEHYLGSPDNMMMGLDVKCTAINNFKIYGELLIDDITTTKLGTDWYGNKLGYSLGAFWVDPLSIDNLDLRIEYTRIRPYVYSHADGINYTHYQSPLGHWSGPNSDNLYSALNYRCSKHLVTTLFAQFNRHGANPVDKNAGGDIERPHVIGDDQTVSFLTGHLEKETEYGLNFSYELIEGCFVQAGYQFSASKNMITKNGQRGDSKGHAMSFSLGLNY